MVGRGKGKSNSCEETNFNEDTLRRVIAEEISKAMPAIVAGIKETQKGCKYKNFMACDPPIFSGENDAIETVRWLEEMESALDISDCAEEDKVKFAAHSFKSGAFFWWNMILQTRGRDVIHNMTWEEFKKLVMDRFCPSYELRKMEMELSMLEMTGLEHRKYTTRFNELSRLTPHMVTPESERISRYIHGLAPEIRVYVDVADPSTYESAVDLAGNLTYNMIRRREEDCVKREMKETSSHAKRRVVESRNEPEKKSKTHFENSHNIIQERGRVGSSACFRCGENGHFARQCPEEKT